MPQIIGVKVFLALATTWRRDGDFVTRQQGEARRLIERLHIYKLCVIFFCTKGVRYVCVFCFDDSIFLGGELSRKQKKQKIHGKNTGDWGGRTSEEQKTLRTLYVRKGFL